MLRQRERERVIMGCVRMEGGLKIKMVHDELCEGLHVNNGDCSYGQSWYFTHQASFCKFTPPTYDGLARNHGLDWFEARRPSSLHIPHIILSLLYLLFFTQLIWLVVVCLFGLLYMSRIFPVLHVISCLSHFFYSVIISLWLPSFLYPFLKSRVKKNGSSNL